LMGGEDAAIKKLNEQFETAEDLGFTAGTSHSVELHPEYSRIPINFGNQPSIQSAFIFSQLNRPDLTQFWSRKVAKTVFGGLSPSTGYNGDEDQGLMGSLAVLIKIGIFQMNGGTEANPEYQIGSPIFDEVTIKLNKDFYSGDQFTIKANNNSDANFYVSKAEFNGASIKANSLRHEDIVNGGELILEMTNTVK
ncbi:MAG: glycoside hydrolase domain-containing protein, partial [Maribacter stanieri]